MGGVCVCFVCGDEVVIMGGFSSVQDRQWIQESAVAIFKSSIISSVDRPNGAQCIKNELKISMT